ncbi:MAG: SGNH/GDSL hydrolase family protein [Ferruginibacter sp.]|nr:SGNH/GDSL hydrolase family protein [Ferruginibacter sp.]
MYTYLALGDSYTVGEQVPLFESFPYQTVQLLRGQGLVVLAPEIVAKTGFTTDELLSLINESTFLSSYDLVTLLIGVNNQYRGRSTDTFTPELNTLAEKAIAFAGGNPQRVVMLSIPDWGVTPFAKEKDSKTICEEIDAYNKVCEETAQAFGMHFINITDTQRIHGHLEEYLATDGLHPSGKEYAVWAGALARVAAKILHSK